MKYCTECGKELASDAKVCENCGKKLVVEEVAPEVATQNNNQVNNTQAKDSNGLAIAGFIISLVSLILCCGSISWLGLLFSIIGLVNSKKVNEKNKGLAIAGIVLGVIGLILIISLYFLGVAASIFESASESVGTSL